jgi:hypothetical protein
MALAKDYFEKAITLASSEMERKMLRQKMVSVKTS